MVKYRRFGGQVSVKYRAVIVDISVISDDISTIYISSIWPFLIDTISTITQIVDIGVQPDIDRDFLNAHGPCTQYVL